MKIKRNTGKGATIRYVLWVEGSLGDMKQMTHLGLLWGGVQNKYQEFGGEGVRNKNRTFRLHMKIWSSSSNFRNFQNFCSLCSLQATSSNWFCFDRPSEYTSGHQPQVIVKVWVSKIVLKKFWNFDVSFLNWHAFLIFLKTQIFQNFTGEYNSWPS